MKSKEKNRHISLLPLDTISPNTLLPICVFLEFSNVTSSAELQYFGTLV